MPLATRRPTPDQSRVALHHPMGVSTGFMWDSRGNWAKQVDAARRTSAFAAEFSVLSEPELPGLLEFFEAQPRLSFRYLSVHGPSKHREMDEEDLVGMLTRLAPYCDGIVMHPDTIEDPRAYLPLGSKLILENMDARKRFGRTAAELKHLFDVLPSAGFCFDIAHAWSIDSTMSNGRELLETFKLRLRHVHLSSMSEDLHHVPLTEDDERGFWPLLSRCLDVPWILEAPSPDRWRD